MMADRRRLARLKRLEKMRALAKDQAAQAAAEAEQTLARLGTLSSRTRSLAASYAGRQDLRDGLALAQIQRFVAGLAGIDAATTVDRKLAAAQADARQRDLAEAERRRGVVQQRLEHAVRTARTRSQPNALGARRATGTGLEE